MAEIRFNYLGQFDHEFDNSLFYYSSGDAGSDAGPANRMTAKLDWNAMIIQGQFCLMIDYNTRAHKASTIHWLLSEFLDNLRRILEHIKREKNIYFTPSDFDAVELDEEDLNALFR
jgi:surfactin family lipopeptide synthetase A